MMKYVFTVAAALLVLGLGMTGCKDDLPLTPNYGTDYGDLQYTLDGVVDTFMEQTDTITMRLYVNRTAGKFEDVRLSLAEAPEGITAQFNPDMSIAPYNATMRLYAKQVEVGDHIIKIMGNSQTTGLRYFDLKLTVLPYSNPALGLDGDFTEKRKCAQMGDTSVPVTVKPIAGQANKILLSGLWMGGGNYIVTATIQPTNQTIIVPMQYSNRLKFEGTGNYSKGRFELSYTVVDTAHGLINDNCTSVFEQK